MVAIESVTSHVCLMFMYCIFRYFSNENVLRIFLALVEFSNLVKLFRITDKNYASKVVVT